MSAFQFLIAARSNPRAFSETVKVCKFTFFFSIKILNKYPLSYIFINIINSTPFFTLFPPLFPPLFPLPVMADLIGHLLSRPDRPSTVILSAAKNLQEVRLPPHPCFPAPSVPSPTPHAAHIPLNRAICPIPSPTCRTGRHFPHLVSVFQGQVARISPCPSHLSPPGP